jgi:hypothetical protein
MLAQMAIEKYVSEVKNGAFPSKSYCYDISIKELQELKASPHWKESPVLKVG